MLLPHTSPRAGGKEGIHRETGRKRKYKETFETTKQKRKSTQHLEKGLVGLGKLSEE